MYLKRQVSALSYLKHEHIVEFLAVEQMHNTGLLFLEYMEGVRKLIIRKDDYL